jgi:hypothetical protein
MIEPIQVRIGSRRSGGELQLDFSNKGFEKLARCLVHSKEAT